MKTGTSYLKRMVLPVKRPEGPKGLKVEGITTTLRLRQRLKQDEQLKIKKEEQKN